MKIVFLCSSLEPGRDGVGDYTRRLAGEIIRQGHQVTAVALNDQYVSEEMAAVQLADGEELPVCRIPALWPAKRRFERAKAYIDKVDPEWLSLQFVPFSFHPKGLSVKLGRQLKKLSAGRNWHIMFHELWVGMDEGSGLKLAWWGRLQRLLIQALLAKLKPAAVHTQTKLYQAYLAELGAEAAYLPLFSNIPVADHIAFKNEAKPGAADAEAPVSLVLFGGIHPGAPIEQFTEEAAAYARENSVSLLLKFVGRCGAEQERWMSTWKAAGLEVEVLGEQPAERISEIFAASDVGIATTPPALLEKSGSVAAMREHCLGVIAVSRPWKPRGITSYKVPPGIAEYQQGNFGACIAGNKQQHHLKLADVTHRFLNTLSAIG